ncbi:hypothetical protein JG687_00011112 [Phytophthora cactorum]|uniref:Gelsolin-like domain-containing protein n=1 Tax=Phytophthora cactorum TaxID=29920 RepID=A0A8T1U7R1_9STRA|nr:hypothetical protein JG687_00011112 [Phytophthora cactorum]
MLATAPVAATKIQAVNLCNGTMELHIGSHGDPITIAQGAGHSLELTDGSNAAYRYGASYQATQAEFANVDSSTWYDISIIPAGNTGGDDSWDQLANYDSEDLTPDSAFLLFSVKSQGLVEGYVWIGSSCSFTLDKVVQAAQKQIQSLSERNSSPSLILEHQNQESDEFWELFEAGY